jgi:hypothetical protein
LYNKKLRFFIFPPYPVAGRFHSTGVLKSLDAQDFGSLQMYIGFWLKTGFHQAKFLFKKGYTMSVSFYYKQMHNMSCGRNKMPLPQCSNRKNHSSKLSSCKKYVYIPEQMLENRGTQILRARLPGQLHYVCDPQYGTHFMSPFWYL